jgi:hypothetical protein
MSQCPACGASLHGLRVRPRTRDAGSRVVPGSPHNLLSGAGSANSCHVLPACLLEQQQVRATLLDAFVFCLFQVIAGEDGDEVTAAGRLLVPFWDATCGSRLYGQDILLQAQAAAATYCSDNG